MMLIVHCAKCLTTCTYLVSIITQQSIIFIQLASGRAVRKEQMTLSSCQPRPPHPAGVPEKKKKRHDYPLVCICPHLAGKRDC